MLICLNFLQTFSRKGFSKVLILVLILVIYFEKTCFSFEAESREKGSLYVESSVSFSKSKTRNIYNDGSYISYDFYTEYGLTDKITIGGEFSAPIMEYQQNKKKFNLSLELLAPMARYSLIDNNKFGLAISTKFFIFNNLANIKAYTTNVYVIMLETGFRSDLFGEITANFSYNTATTHGCNPGILELYLTYWRTLPHDFAIWATFSKYHIMTKERPAIQMINNTTYLNKDYNINANNIIGNNSLKITFAIAKKITKKTYVAIQYRCDYDTLTMNDYSNSVKIVQNTVSIGLWCEL